MNRRNALRMFTAGGALALLPLVVPVNALHNAITWQSSAWEIANISGPALAGMAVASAGSRVVYLAQCVCAALTLACFYLLKFRSLPVTEAPAPDGKEILEGVRFVWRDKLVLSAISLDMFAVLFGGATALLPIFAIETLHAGARGFGWLRAAPALGAVSMALLMAHIPKARSAGSTLLVAVAGFGAATVVFGVSRSLWLSFAMLLATGAFDNISVVLRQTLVQTKPPDRCAAG